ncbi:MULTISPECIES: DUF736 family protein [unclassified Sphingopyxis]|uniref:DUF736 domain-containing protein n=1 Tax=unclassified Sphingopyxis TaxID=2614943 RepID=UPI000BA4FC16|nr:MULTISPECIES: DUF736 family protein [unclassified Sphingopyxis]PAL19321.1 hypothetical protein CD928_22775 [Sphingopyxis sp. GW247-27LB]HMO76991.1 DUF736 family protein [Sphingopyxis sp.]
MANIGNLKKNSDGVFIGRIDTVAFSNVVALRPVISQNDAAPKYEVMALTPARTWAKVGAMFEQIKKSTGEVFYQGRIDDPSMANPMDIALWHDREGGFAVLWSRRRPRREIPAGQAEQDLPPVGQSSDDGIGGDSGLGDSTAPDAPQTGKGKGAAGKGGETADKATA